MNIKVRRSKCQGVVKLPASKSDMHRAIFAACLSNGESRLENITLSSDVEATINAFKALGAIIKQEEDCLIIQGIKGFDEVDLNEIDCNESGSTLRFLIPVLSMFNSSFTLKGKESLFSRPLNVYEEIYSNQNLKFELNKKSLKIQGKLKEGEYVIRGNISSQFISGLMFALPLLKGDSKIKILPPFESKSYVNMTIKTLEEFGIIIYQISEYEYEIKGNQMYKPTTYKVESDYSQFAFYAVLGAINNDITCRGLNFKSLQGDRDILKILDSFKVKYSVNNDSITVHKPVSLEGDMIDLSNCPDLGPSLIVLSLFNNKPVKIINIHRLRLKESDRVEAMVTNLRKMKAKIEVFDNQMIIYPSKIKPPKEILSPYNDHRILMSLVILASMLNGVTTIKNPECVKKSYVNFYKDMQTIGIDIGLSN